MPAGRVYMRQGARLFVWEATESRSKSDQRDHFTGDHGGRRAERGRQDRAPPFTVQRSDSYLGADNGVVH
jgi:hypothetical protein